jgi:hypothetical protein
MLTGIESLLCSAVPVFNGLVGLVGALFGAFLCILVTVSPGLCSSRLVSPRLTRGALLHQSCMWLYLYGEGWRTGSTKLKVAVAAHVGMAIIGAFLMVGGVSLSAS